MKVHRTPTFLRLFIGRHYVTWVFRGTPARMYRFHFDYSRPRYWLRRDHLFQCAFYRGNVGCWQITLGPFRLMRIRKYASVREFMNEAWDEFRDTPARSDWFNNGS